METIKWLFNFSVEPICLLMILIPSFNTKLPKGCQNDDDNNDLRFSHNFHRYTLILSNSSVAPESQVKSRPLSSHERSKSAVSLKQRTKTLKNSHHGSFILWINSEPLLYCCCFFFIIIIMLLKKRDLANKTLICDINDKHSRRILKEQKQNK